MNYSGKVIFSIILLLTTTALFGKGKQDQEELSVLQFEPDKLYVFRNAYPDITFTSEYDEEVDDWKIKMEIPSGKGTRTSELYWSNGSLLPYSELPNKDKYWTLLYHYDYENFLQDPANFTEEQIQAMKIFGSNEARKNGAGTPMFFFDEIYDTKTRGSTETHIKKTTFLGKSTNVHERIIPALKRVEEKIYSLAKEDAEVEKFIQGLSSTAAYNWRLIANTNRKSFHCLGISLDILPKSYGGKQVYWSWAKDQNPENWMLTPLKSRWIPPEVVVEAFESEGFIWGGKWAIWDNMHFEYHPELFY